MDLVLIKNFGSCKVFHRFEFAEANEAVFFAKFVQDFPKQEVEKEESRKGESHKYSQKYNNISLKKVKIKYTS